MLEVQRDGDSYLSNATIDGRFALRACIVNYRTTPAGRGAVAGDTFGASRRRMSRAV